MENEQTHILIVDDSGDDRNMYTYYLTRKGYRVSNASDGMEGLEKAIELRPDLILLDLRLPLVGGWEATNRLRADERTRKCAIVIITGAAIYQPSSIECDGWITKPCPPDHLDAEITRILKTRSARKESPQQNTRPVPPPSPTAGTP